MSIDRLSALPDSTLRYILSFLEIKDAAITCLLSKRWQYLWTKLPFLIFEEDRSSEMENIRKFVNRVHRTLVICRRDNLEYFEVDFRRNYNQHFASDVNAWIAFAIENKVKIFNLLLPGAVKCSHKLPQMMYSNPSWTSLDLHGCIMAPRGTIDWQSLATLCIGYVELNEHTFENILSGCPVLSILGLEFCRGFNRLEVKSSGLHTLGIDDMECGDDLKISAPYIHTLKIGLYSKARKLCLENIKSLVRAEITIKEGDTKSAKENLKQLFRSIPHVKMLELDGQCIKFLSLIAPNWNFPQSTRGCLELHASPGSRSIPGILGLLKSSPNLETLVIRGCKLYYLDNFPSNPAPDQDLDCDLVNLKTVYFKKFGCLNLDTCESVLILTRILLKRAIVLEKMIIDFQGFTASSAPTAFYKMMQKLLSYPRVSRKAVVLFY